MTFPYIHLYNKPKSQVDNGAQFISRHSGFGYRHTIDAMGWFDTMKCSINLPQHASESFFQDYLGNEVRVYFDNPSRIVWEGFINRMVLKRAGLVTTRSLEEMTNRVQVIYDDPSTTPQQSRTTAVSNADSIAVYGSKSATFEAGTNRGAETLTTGIGDLKLAQLAWPKMSSAPDTSGGLSLEIECLGFYHTLGWDKYVVTNTTIEAVGLVVARYLFGTTSPTYVGWNSSTISGNGNGLFYDDTDSDDWNGNTSYNAVRELRSTTVWEHLVKMCQAGDGTDDWLVGLTPTILSKGYRRAYYRQANTAVKYTAALSDGLRVRNIYGGLVSPWEITPDASIRITDLATGHAQGEDPREMWIKKITYDAENNNVTWQGKDDITLEGLFGFKDVTKDMGGKFDAPERTVYV